MTLANDLFPVERKIDDDGREMGMTQVDLGIAVEAWFWCESARSEGGQRTVGEAAHVFNVSPEFLAAALDRLSSPYFFAWPDDEDPAARVLEVGDK